MAAAVIEDPASTQSVIMIVNQAAYASDPSQTESLLHSDQARMM